MQVCTSLKTDKNASTPPLNFFAGWMPFLPPNQQRQSTEGQVQFSSINITGENRAVSASIDLVGDGADIVSTNPA